MSELVSASLDERCQNATLKIRCLGPFSIQGSHGWEFLPSLKKGRELIGFLAIRTNAIATRVTLSEAFWPQADTQRAAHRLHLAASGARAVLRSALNGFNPLRCIAGGYAWHPDLVVESDVERFLACARLGTVEAAHKGIELYIGDFLAGEHGDWVDGIRVRCSCLYIGMLELVATHAFAQHEYVPALAYGLEISDYDRAHEGASRLVMRCFAALGQRNRAFAEYNALKGYLARNLNVVPTEETTELLRSIMAPRAAYGTTSVSGSNETSLTS